MDPLYDDPDARPRRLAVLAGFGIIIATGFATIAAMVLGSGARQDNTALPDSIITTTNSSTSHGNSVGFRTADKSDPDALRSGSPRHPAAGSAGRHAPSNADPGPAGSAGPDRPDDDRTPGRTDDGDGGGSSEDPPTDPPDTSTSTSEPNHESPLPPKDPSEESSSSTTSTSASEESTKPSSSTSPRETSDSSQAASSGSGGSQDRKTTA